MKEASRSYGLLYADMYVTSNAHGSMFFWSDVTAMYSWYRRTHGCTLIYVYFDGELS